MLLGVNLHRHNCSSSKSLQEKWSCKQHGKSKGKILLLRLCPEKKQPCTRADIKQTLIKATPAASCAVSCGDSSTARFAVSHTSADARTGTVSAGRSRAGMGRAVADYNCCARHSQQVPLPFSPQVIYSKLVLSVHPDVRQEFYKVSNFMQEREHNKPKPLRSPSLRVQSCKFNDSD